MSEEKSIDSNLHDLAKRLAELEGERERWLADAREHQLQAWHSPHGIVLVLGDEQHKEALDRYNAPPYPYALPVTQMSFYGLRVFKLSDALSLGFNPKEAKDTRPRQADWRELQNAHRKAIIALWDVLDAFHHTNTPYEERFADPDKIRQLPHIMNAVCKKLLSMPPGQTASTPEAWKG